MTDQMPHIEANASTEINPSQALAQGPSRTDHHEDLAGKMPALHLDGCEHQEQQLGTFIQPKGANVPAVSQSNHDRLEACPTLVGRSESELSESLRRAQVIAEYEALVRGGCNPSSAARMVGVSRATIHRWRQPDGTQTKRHNSGRRADLELTEAEVQALQRLYLRTNKDEQSGSMRTTAKFFALAPDTRDEVRDKILAALAARRIPGAIKRALERVTRAHVSGRRRPKMNAVEHFSGTVGAFVGDKIERRRVIESDDGTVNFVCTIPWPMGGDPCSDKYGLRIGRWQFLPAIEAGWSHFYLGYELVCRPRGSYRAEDIRALIHLVARMHGLPDGFRFERGAWESNAVVELLGQLGVTLNTVYQSNQKPFVEGGFNPLWTYLSVLGGPAGEAQVGRYRGEMETENRLVEKCKAGRANPSEHFPTLSQAITALDGALAMRNSDEIDSIYGRFVPEVRFKAHAEQRPWKPLPTEMSFLFAPYVREWTVSKGSVGGKLPLLDDYDVPFYFAHEELWRWNGRKVRLYFDPAAAECAATIVSLGDFHGFRKGEVICKAELAGDLPHFARASFGWSEEAAGPINAALKLARAACRREVRALTEGGQVKASVSEARDGGGNVVRVERGERAQEQGSGVRVQRSEGGNQSTALSRGAATTTLSAPTADAWARRRARLAEDAAAARDLAQQRSINNNTEEQ